MKLTDFPAGSFYAGIGSRETPKEICDLMSKIAIKLYTKYGFILRTGGADGADMAFINGVNTLEKEDNKFFEIYLPWNKFNDFYTNLDKECIVIYDQKIIKDAQKLVQKFHPDYKVLTQGGMKLMERNGYQLLGGNLNTPSSFVICWTKDSADGNAIPTSISTGGTGQAIRLANFYKIPVINLKNSDKLKKWSDWVNK